MSLDWRCRKYVAAPPVDALTYSQLSTTSHICDECADRREWRFIGDESSERTDERTDGRTDFWAAGPVVDWRFGRSVGPFVCPSSHSTIITVIDQAQCCPVARSVIRSAVTSRVWRLTTAAVASAGLSTRVRRRPASRPIVRAHRECVVVGRQPLILSSASWWLTQLCAGRSLPTDHFRQLVPDNARIRRTYWNDGGKSERWKCRTAKTARPGKVQKTFVLAVCLTREFLHKCKI